MKLSKRAEVDAFFKNPPAGCAGALIYGKDRSQVIERATGLARQIVPDITDPFNVSLLTDSDIEADPARLEGELQSLSLMGGKRLIRLKFFTEKASLDKAVAVVVKAHAAGEYNPEAFIIIEAGNLGEIPPCAGWPTPTRLWPASLATRTKPATSSAWRARPWRKTAWP